MEALTKESTRPRSTPTMVSEPVRSTAIEIRARLKKNGWDYGPKSVAAKMRRMGIKAPAPATLHRIFTQAGLVTPQPRKRPRSSYRRFVHPNPNSCWQIDATGWQLQDRTAVIFEIIDDHSRLELVSMSARSKNSEDAVRAVSLAIERYGVPQKVLSDNGTALNPSRRGWEGALVKMLKALGVKPITGKPSSPTTQGKNERIHSTLQRFLTQQPPVATLNQLQDQLDLFRPYYNTEREHQALNGKTPQEAWDAMPKASPPQPPPVPEAQPEETTRRACPKGSVKVRSTMVMLGHHHARQTITIIITPAAIMFFDAAGTEIRSITPPEPGTTYIGNNQPRGFMANQQSTKS
ncbi:transposase InsO family protein [Arthrobacter pigmenti]|uniref:Transposase InsO family protein n=1 Tax=Arthrobacter pigmenti TaxID=271432 RepID=A0A846RWI5_9MICC|nr:integrase core domain-containing protein [Arthrobacter pigmenti]NJC23386.1 transposase InsO family protein [Arthrobacter pigmenti]